MKKLFLLLTVLCTGLLVIGCKKDTTQEDYVAVENAAKKLFADVDLMKINHDLEFVSSIDGVQLTYTTNNPDVISTTGKVNFQDTETKVTIVVHLKLNKVDLPKIFNVTVVSKADLPAEVTTIASVKSLTQETKVAVHGIVSRIIYGTEKNVPTGFYVFDSTDAIYVYSQTFAATLSAGDEVTVFGNYTMYVDGAESAAAAGYTGARQIVPTSVTQDGKGKELPLNGVTKSSIAELKLIPVSTNITSNVYEVTAKIRKVQGVGFVNYYFDDADGVSSYYAYTTANGKDLTWLDQYDGEYHTCLIAVQNCKLSASGNFWRIVPLVIGDKVELSAKEEANYALDRVVKQFSTKYDASCEVVLSTLDTVLEDATVSYEVVSGPLQLVQSDVTKLKITASATLASATVKVSISYKGETVSKDVTFSVKEESPEINTITIATARAKEVGEQVTIKGILVGFLYLSGTSKPAGFELLDETGSIAVFVSTAVDTKTDITKLQVGEYVYVTGTKDLYQPRTDYNHDGSIRLNNAEVLYHDYQNHEIPENAIPEATLKELIQNPSDNNISNAVYKTTFFLEKSNGSYKNFYLHSLEDPSLSIIVYSQNSGANGPGEYNWLDQYVGKCVEAYVTLRIGAKSSGVFIWKSGVLQVLGEVDTPDTIVEYLVGGTIKNAFAKEYTEATTVNFSLEKGTLTLKSSDLTDVVLTNNGNDYTVSIPKASSSKAVNLVFTYTLGSTTADITVSFNYTVLSLITIAEARGKAVKNGETVSIEGVVIQQVRSEGSSSWGVFIADSTGVMFVKQTSTAEVGDKLSIVGSLDLYYGMPQIASGATISVISKGNAIPDNTFNKNATINDLVQVNAAGESGKLGATVYLNVTGTFHCSSTGVYITVGDVRINMYYYTNAKYYAYNYTALESLDGKEVKLDLISYNVYNGEYTFVINNIQEVNK